MDNCYFSKTILENHARRIYNLIAPISNNISSNDGQDENGEIWEIKDLSGRIASLTNASAEENVPLNLQVSDRSKAKWYVIYFGERNVIDESKFLVLNKQQFIEWVLPRIVLDRKSGSQDYKFRFGKNFRTEKATKKLEEKGIL